jgi:hypothetical protein
MGSGVVNAVAKKQLKEMGHLENLSEFNKKKGKDDFMAGHAGTIVQNAALSSDEFGPMASQLGLVAEIPSMLLASQGLADGAGAAAAQAGAMADARNGHAREAVMRQAGTAARDMNLQNAAQTAAMTDSAIANRNAYESGMADIGMSGIDGSANMERNLQYGKSRAEAEQQMQYELMGNEAADLSGSMAQSFGELSQGKTRDMQSAWSEVVTGAKEANTAQWMAQNAEEQKLTMDWLASDKEADKQIAFEAGAEAGQNGPDSGDEAEPQTGQTEPDAAAANRNAIVEKEDRDAAAWEAQKAAQAQAQASPAPAQAQTAQAAQDAAAGAADMSSHYGALEAFLNVKGGVSASALDAKMAEMGIDENMRRKIQAETMSATGGDWRGRLRAALKG